MNRRDELIHYWNDIPSARRKYERLSARGAVASLLASGRSLPIIRSSFDEQAPRLTARYPAFWRDVQALLATLESEAAELAAIEQVVAELDA